MDDEIRRKEEEELQRVLEMSIQDKGGRTQWSTYAASSSGAAASSSASGSSVNRHSSASASMSKPSSSGSGAYAGQKYQAGYVPARTPSPTPVTPHVQQQQQHPVAQAPGQQASPTPSTATASTAVMPAGVVSRVRALHTFEPTEPGELAFDKGDIIKVVDRGYKDWWRGQLKGRMGIFPVNYVVRFLICHFLQVGILVLRFLL